MKNVLLTSAAIVAFASAASAFDLGNGLALGAEVVTAYTVDAKDMTTVVTPALSYSLNTLTATASTDLSVWNNGWVGNDTVDVKPTLDLELSFMVNPNVELLAETSFDLEANDGRDEVTLSATLNF
jgi:hypothetical protein